MRFEVIGWPAMMLTRGTVPATSPTFEKNSCGYVVVGRFFSASHVGSIGIRGWRSLVETTTDWVGLVGTAAALIATRTKAAITSRARTIPRRVNGLRDVRPVRDLRNADPS